MNHEQTLRQRIRAIGRILFVIFRYVAGVVVAFVASIATIIYLPHLFPAWTSNGYSFFWDFKCLFCTGLAGVAAGSFCLPRIYRWIGSLFLLFLGLGFALFVFCSFSEDDSGGANLFPLVPLTAGGIIPVVIHYLLRSKSESKLLTEKEALTLVVSGAFLAIAIFWLSYLSGPH
jgi:hypothetical protein